MPLVASASSEGHNANAAASVGILCIRDDKSTIMQYKEGGTIGSVNELDGRGKINEHRLLWKRRCVAVAGYYY